MSWASGGANPFDELVNPPVKQRAPSRKTQLDTIDAFSSMGFGDKSATETRNTPQIEQTHITPEKRLSDSGRRLFNSFSGRDGELLVPINQQASVLQPESKSTVSAAQAGVSFDPYRKNANLNPDSYGKRPSTTSFVNPSPAYGTGGNSRMSSFTPGNQTSPNAFTAVPYTAPHANGFGPVIQDPFAATPPAVPPSDPFASAPDDPFATNFSHGDPFASQSKPSASSSLDAYQKDPAANSADEVDAFLQEEMSREKSLEILRESEGQDHSREQDVSSKKKSAEIKPKSDATHKNAAVVNEGVCKGRITRKDMLTKNWQDIFWFLELSTSTLLIYRTRDDYYYQPKGKMVKKAIQIKETVTCSEITMKDYKANGELFHFTLEEAGSALGRFAVDREHHADLKILRDQVIGAIGALVERAEIGTTQATRTPGSEGTGGFEAVPKTKARKSVILGDWTNLEE